MRAELDKREGLVGLQRTLRIEKTVDTLLAAANVQPE